MCILGGLIPMNVMAQETVVISGDPEKYSSSTTDYAPIRTYNSRSYSQFLYLKEELNMDEGASITGISFKVNKSDNAFPFSRTKIKVYLSSTELTNFTSTTMIKPSANDLLFEGTMTFSGIGWLTITLDNPYTYDGKNILVSVWDNQDSYIEYTYFDSFTPIDANSEERRCAYKTGNSANPVTATIYGSLHAHTPQIQFTFTPAGPSVPTPPTVTLNTPEDNATGIFNPSLNFTLGSADQYQIQMSEGEGEFAIVQDWTKGNGSISYQTSLLKPNTVYLWKVVAKNDNGETTSKVYKFTTKEFAAPGAITNVSPENNAEGLINPVLSWTFGADTEQQQLLIDGVVKVDWTNIGTKISDSYQTSGLAAGGHTWQVNTQNGAGVTTGTEYSFTVASRPDNVTPISPANGATNVNSNVIKWQFADNTTEYRFLFSAADPEDEDVVFDETFQYWNGTNSQSNWLQTNGAEEMEIEMRDFEPSTTYYWIVDVKNSVGERIHYGGDGTVSIQSFTTASVLNTKYMSPANGATNLANPTLSWNYNGTPEYYQVLMGTSENDLNAMTEWLATEGTGGTYQTENLNNATEYYWQVNVKKGETVLEGEVWSFVTTLPVPTGIAANPVQIVPTLSMTYGSTTISWDDMGATGYNVYLGTTQLNAELITETSYEIAANSMKLSYNMNPGYEISVQAVYAIGESNVSEAVNVKVTGFGYFKSIIYSNDYYHRLEGATVTLTCTEDEFENEYDGDGIVYTFTTNALGQVFETIEMPNGETVTNTSLKLYNGTYAVNVEKEYHNSYTGTVTILNNETTEPTDMLLIPDNTYIFEVTPFNATLESIDVYVDASPGQYHVYLKEGEEITDLGMQYFVADNSVAYFKYTDWANLNNGDYQFGVAKAEDQINWSEIVTRDYNIFEVDGNLSAAENWRDGLPEEGEDICINANATIGTEESLTFGNVTINTSGSLTINGSLTADNVTNTNVSKLVLNDGAQLRQNNSSLVGKFNMDIINPTVWSNDNQDGWQFISSPFTNASISNFTTVNGSDYDLYKFDGSQAGGEWVNHKTGNDENDSEEDNGNDNIVHGGAKEGTFETSFVNGSGYLTSYESAESATFSGTINSEQSHTWNVTYTENADNGDLANFHLLGNPFAFDMDWNNVKVTNMVSGFAVLNVGDDYDEDGEAAAGSAYVYKTAGTIKVGDAFFVKTTDEAPKMTYQETAASMRSNSESINLIATGAEGCDNLIISLSGAENEGFNKLENFNKDIATVFVVKNDIRYGIANFDSDVTMIDVAFNATKMGNYTISAQPNGKFETLTLIDRFTGIETNLLVEDYHFTATSNDNYNRFIIKLEVNSQEPTDNSNFAYVSGEDLIFNVEGSVQIIDMMGRVVYTSEIESANNRINVSEFNSAAYVVRIVNENGVKTQKIIL